MQWCDIEERLLDGQIRGVDSCFSETLKQSRDYHIAYMYQVGYVSVLGLYERDSTQNNSMKIDEVFHSPEEMADSLLRNWRWQWFYKNRKLLGCQDFENICNLDNKSQTCFRKNTDKVYKSFRIKSILLYRWKIKTVYKQCVR